MAACEGRALQFGVLDNTETLQNQCARELYKTHYFWPQLSKDTSAHWSDMGTLVLPATSLNKETERRLVSAAGEGDISTVRKLLRKKADVNVKDDYGNTALVSASKGETIIYKRFHSE
jgi:ankyrin repeat protein